MVLSDDELRNVIVREKEYLESIVDPVQRKCQMAFISGLELNLNE